MFDSCDGGRVISGSSALRMAVGTLEACPRLGSSDIAVSASVTANTPTQSSSCLNLAGSGVLTSPTHYVSPIHDRRLYRSVLRLDSLEIRCFSRVTVTTTP